MSEELNIRLGNKDDIDDIMELAEQACLEHALLAPSSGKMVKLIYPILTLETGISAVLTSNDNKVVGVIMLLIGEMWYSEEKILEEVAIYISPKYRNVKGGWAKKLCEFAKKVSDNLKVPLVVGVASNVRTEAKIKLYERQYGKPTGAFFFYKEQTG